MTYGGRQRRRLATTTARTTCPLGNHRRLFTGPGVSGRNPTNRGRRVAERLTAVGWRTPSNGQCPETRHRKIQVGSCRRAWVPPLGPAVAWSGVAGEIAGQPSSAADFNLHTRMACPEGATPSPVSPSRACRPCSTNAHPKLHRVRLRAGGLRPEHDGPTPASSRTPADALAQFKAYRARPKGNVQPGRRDYSLPDAGVRGHRHHVRPLHRNHRRQQLQQQHADRRNDGSLRPPRGTPRSTAPSSWRARSTSAGTTTINA
jgi:hypothetical protein